MPRFHVTIQDSQLLELLNTESCLGGHKIEGVVVKNYKCTADGKYMVGKFVSEAFKERHEKEWGERNPGRQDIIEDIIQSLKTEPRRLKAVQHLAEKGELQNVPQDIGKLFKEMQNDIDGEESDYIKERLYRHFKQQIQRGVCSGLAEWYKERLEEA